MDQQFLEELADLPPDTFDHRFAKTSARLGLGVLFDRNELKLSQLKDFIIHRPRALAHWPDLIEIVGDGCRRFQHVIDAY